jgi:hypothetical protein
LDRVNREIIRPLAAWDTGVSYPSVLQPGTVLSECRILRNNGPGDEPYVVEFDSGGRRYSCPLFAIQLRTQAFSARMEIEFVDQALAI